MRLWVLYQVKSLVPTIENLIGVLCETAAKINYCRLVVAKKTFKKFLESFGGSDCDFRCVIYEDVYILKSSEVQMW